MRLANWTAASHVVDETNRLTSDDNYTYVYDLNGNLIQKLAKEELDYRIGFTSMVRSINGSPFQIVNNRLKPLE